MTVVKNRLAAWGASLYEGTASEASGELAVVLMWSLLGLFISATIFFPDGLPLG